MHKTIAKIYLTAILLSCFLLLPVYAIAIPMLGVAPGDPSDSSYANLSYDGFPIGLDGGQITIWYGSDSGNINYDSTVNDLWLLTTSANGGDFSFDGVPFVDPVQDLSVASYKDPVYGVNLTDSGFDFPGSWEEFNDLPEPNQTFYSYEFGTGSKDFRYLTGNLDVGTAGLVIGDWMYAVLEGNSVDAFSPKTTSTHATPEPATMLLFGSGLLGLARFRKKIFKK
jgi:hypothetical protein